MPGLLGNPNIAAQYAAGIQSGIEQQMIPYNQGLLGSQAAYYGQEAQAKSLANQKTLMLMPMFQKLAQGEGLHPTFNTSDGTTPTDDLDVGDATNQGTRDQDPALSTGSVNNQTPKDILAAMEAKAKASANRYAPPSMAMDPQNAARYAQLLALAKESPLAAGAAEGYRAEFEAHQTMKAQMNQIQAERAFNNAMDVYGTDDAHTRATLNQVDKNAVNNPMLDKLSPAQMREYSGVIASAYHPYTGRPTEVDGAGYIRDQKSQQKLPGREPVDMKQEDFQKEIDYWAGSDKYTINGEDRFIPRYLGTNYKSAEMGHPTNYASAYDAAEQNVRNRKALQGQGTPATNKISTTPSTSGYTSKPANPKSPVVTLVPPGTAAKNNLYQGFEPNSDPTKPSIDVNQLPANPKPVGMTGPSSNVEANEAAAEHARAVIKMDTVTRPTSQNAAQKAIFDERNLLRLVNSPNTAFGPGTGTAAAIQTVIQAFGDENSYSRIAQFADDPANRQLIGKLFGNEAIQNYTKQMHEAGGTERMSAYLSNIITQQLSANPTLARNATRQILRLDLASNLYDAQKWGTDYDAAKTAGKDMAQYDGKYGSIKKYNTFMINALNAMDNAGNIKPQYQNTGLPPVNPVAQAAAKGSPPIKISSEDEYNKLPNNTSYIWNGQTYTKGQK